MLLPIEGLGLPSLATSLFVLKESFYDHWASLGMIFGQYASPLAISGFLRHNQRY